MKVLYHLLYRHSTGADRWIAETWQAGFEYHGHKFDFYDGRRIDAEKIRATGAHLFITDLALLSPEDTEELIKLRGAGVKVAVWVIWPLTPSFQKMDDAMRMKDFADLYFGEREPEGMGDFEVATGKCYVTIANAARHDIHRRVPFDPRYAFDIAFVGAKLPHKRWMNQLLLEKLRPRYRVGLFGPGWTLRDKFVGFVARAARKLRFTALSGLIDRLRVSLPLEKEPVLYSSSKICINFHEREPDGSVSHNIINQRLFKIAASGGFQIVDDMPGIERYFDAGEVITLPLDADLWLQRIESYLNNEQERERIRANAASRGKDHYSMRRVEQLLSAMGIT